MRAAITPIHVRADLSGTAGCTVLKIGGGLLVQDGALDQVCADINRARAQGSRLVIVTGGGPFADQVRTISRHEGIGDDASHWMAIHAMEQYAEWLVTRISFGVCVGTPYEAGAALDSGRIPVMMPMQWLRRADTLPHSWSCTSDSIAAFIAGALDAARLILIKPVDGPVTEMVDDLFSSVVPAGLDVRVVRPDGDWVDTLR